MTQLTAPTDRQNMAALLLLNLKDSNNTTPELTDQRELTRDTTLAWPNFKGVVHQLHISAMVTIELSD